MIPFEEIDKRLDQLGKNRTWLAETSGRSEGAIRTALAPNSAPKNRSNLLQRALSEAIEREEAQQRKAPVVPDRITLEVDPADFDAFSEAALAEHKTIKAWAIDSLNAAAAAAKVVPISRDKLAGVDGPARVAKDDSQPPATISEKRRGGGYQLPRRGQIAAGAPIDVVEWSNVEVPKEYPEGHYVLEVNGRSMEPKIANGSLIVVRDFHSHEGTPKQGTIVVYSDSDGSTLKEFGYRKATAADDPETVNSMGKVAVLRSLNKGFPEVKTLDNGRITGILVEVLR